MSDIGDVTDDVFDERNPVNRSGFEGELDAVVSCTDYILVVTLVKPNEIP